MNSCFRRWSLLLSSTACFLSVTLTKSPPAQAQVAGVQLAENSCEHRGSEHRNSRGELTFCICKKLLYPPKDLSNPCLKDWFAHGMPLSKKLVERAPVLPIKPELKEEKPLHFSRSAYLTTSKSLFRYDLQNNTVKKECDFTIEDKLMKPNVRDIALNSFGEIYALNAFCLRTEVCSQSEATVGLYKVEPGSCILKAVIESVSGAVSRFKSDSSNDSLPACLGASGLGVLPSGELVIAGSSVWAYDPSQKTFRNIPRDDLAINSGDIAYGADGYLYETISHEEEGDDLIKLNPTTGETLNLGKLGRNKIWGLLDAGYARLQGFRANGASFEFVPEQTLHPKKLSRHFEDWTGAASAP